MFAQQATLCAAMCRQVLVGATSGERHITEALLQAELSSCSGAVSGLPALEACLLALEGTDGGSPSKAHTSMAERFISAVLTCLNLAATCAAPGWPAFPGKHPPKLTLHVGGPFPMNTWFDLKQI